MKKKFKLSFLFFILCTATFWLVFKTTLFDPIFIEVFGQSTISSTDEIENEPIVFIHGYDGSNWTFFTTTLRYSLTDFATRSISLTVLENGEIESHGTYNKNVKRPMIRINFDNPTAEITNNSEWLEKAMTYLKTSYSIKRVSIVAHSYGGLTFTKFAQHFDETKYPTIDKFIAIGTPFNGSELAKNGKTPYDLGTNGPKKESVYFSNLFNHRMDLSPNLTFLNIVGDLDNGSRSDGAVAVDSALSARYIFKSENYQEKIFHGIFAQHSLLHMNFKVDTTIQHFLTTKPIQKSV
ncbi:alpha/beta hydrolase [Carnobacterium maltaromaticum]|uniref:alpha/beta hydrolase n=1 Tax=Carnobacterium maltaromaticum TaxID=2751 RepID=UPI001072531E|nr:alpha/beta hydrolase [Carnobacterium maltaromaticum]TFJ76257.1 hypothetical protein CKN94_02475 [Carnobacterium maltaromaticum]TFJ79057.1 hypothetical protein CKN97_02470 [Carnobacterium maltaromaticum]